MVIELQEHTVENLGAKGHYIDVFLWNNIPTFMNTFMHAASTYMYTYMHTCMVYTHFNMQISTQSIHVYIHIFEHSRYKHAYICIHSHIHIHLFNVLWKGERGGWIFFGFARMSVRPTSGFRRDGMHTHPPHPESFSHFPAIYSHCTESKKRPSGTFCYVGESPTVTIFI